LPSAPAPVPGGAASVATGTDACPTDLEQACVGWSKSGQCTKNPVYMKNTCPKSCASRFPYTDKDPSCKAWAAAGKCKKDEKYMKEKCTRSCCLTIVPGPTPPPADPIHTTPSPTALRKKTATSTKGLTDTSLSAKPKKGANARAQDASCETTFHEVSTGKNLYCSTRITQG
jgi:hypothetical protein